MISTPGSSTPPPSTTNVDRALALALRLAHAENALHTLGSGQIDAVIDSDGRAYLLRPAQESLRQSERRLQAVVDSVPDVITVVNRGGLILSQSQAARRVLGCEPEESVGKNIFEIIHDDELATVHSAFINVIEGFQETAAFQFRHLAGDGSYRIIQATVAKLRDVHPANLVLSLRPAALRASEHAPARQEIAGLQTLLAKDRFLAIVAHELSTPLAPALLGIQELQQDERFSEAGLALAMIRRNIELEKRLLAILFDFTSLGQRKVKPQVHRIDLHETVRLALETCRPEIASAQVQVLLDLRASEALVIADSVKLQQVMWNLIKNAVKFSPTRSTISVSTFNEPPDQLVIEFADHGIGIEPELLPLIFDSFQQGDSSRHRISGSLGLGLFIAKGLAEAQGGTLSAFSEGHSKGATFRLTLPKAPPDGGAPSQEHSTTEN